jgi:hypothetical protein
LGKSPDPSGAKDTIRYRPIAGKRSRVEEGGQISAVVDMQVGQQNGIHFF